MEENKTEASQNTKLKAEKAYWKPLEIDERMLDSQVKLQIEGLDVYFPHEPYDIQIAYMSNVIRALENSQNALLQSPTGTGKTLSLLCSTLAWLSKKRTCELQESGEITRIIYSSKTHSQLEQVVSELKKTIYRPSSAVLASRDHYCVKKEFMTFKGTKLNSACNLARKSKSQTGKCGYHTALSMNGVNYFATKIGSKIRDIEELRSEGRTKSFCPYFYSMKMKNNVDILFLPYSYLLEYKTLALLDLNFHNDIIIFDEAHNVEKCSEEGYSLEIGTEDLSDAIKEIENLIVQLEKSDSIGFSNPTFDREFQSTINEARTIQRSLELFIEYLHDFSRKKNIFNMMDGLTLDGKEIFSIVQQGTNSRDSKDPFEFGINLEIPTRYLTVIIKMLEDMATMTNAKLDNWAIFVDLVKHLYLSNSVKKKGGKGDSLLENEINSYKICLKAEGNGQILLQFWCFNPAIGFSRFGHDGARSLLLTSGTLSPFKSFESELQLEFPIKLANPHVIEPKTSLYATILSKGPSGMELNFSFNSRKDETMIKDLGEFIFHVCKAVHNGILVFFSSYVVMDFCTKVWHAGGHNSIYKRINDVKSLVIEPRNATTSESQMNNFIRAANTIKGACLFAVCRGKFAEGIDFTDNLARAVILVGIPYPPSKDPKINLKKSHVKHVKEYEKDRGSKNHNELLSEHEWYKLQAIRAANQAIGRVIRHKNDYGAIYLVDSRFNQPDIKNHLSGWIRENLEPNEEYGTILKRTILFMKIERIQLLPNILKKRKPEDSSIIGNDIKFGISNSLLEETKENTDTNELEDLLNSPINGANGNEDSRYSSGDFFDKFKSNGNQKSIKNTLMKTFSFNSKKSDSKSKSLSTLESTDLKNYLNPEQTLEQVQHDGKKKFIVRSNKKEVKGLQCMICLENSENVAVPSCGHVACMPCWKEWLKTKLRCPLCTKRVREKKLTPIYFN